MNDKTIDSILEETRQFPPSKESSTGANITKEELEQLKKQASDDYEGFWAQLAKENLYWFKEFTTVLNEENAPNYEWFGDGEINVSYNCLDKNVESSPNKTAIIFEAENGDTRRISYKELLEEVSLFANGLLSLGVETGDRVIIYMPMSPEAVVAMQACARIGAIHSVVFGGFSSNALKDRIDDAKAKIVITADGAFRGGKTIPLKQATDNALKDWNHSIEHVIVLKRTGESVSILEGRDLWWKDLIKNQNKESTPVPLSSEHPLFILYTSGSTGKPKGIQHSSGGYLLHAKMTFKWIFDIKDSDVFWCTADVGWVTGHTYVTYGPLAAGATILIYEGAPTYPHGGRFWEICEKHQVSLFYTAPTAIRALMKLGDDIPNKYDLSNLRLLGTVGEPINPEAWMWYHTVIGKEKCPIVDTWWQTETGAAMISPLPGVTATKPGSCTQALPGISVDIVDEGANPERST
ncbi:MAG: hypothetical protein Ct9H300mP6_03530 [Gammaproteobacteria bacterium]|nr:MAG: hypothetical protein Ct9H300mP6_03530 [Gammaproteobacteria bacterium]